VVEKKQGTNTPIKKEFCKKLIFKPQHKVIIGTIYIIKSIIQFLNLFIMKIIKL